MEATLTSLLSALLPKIDELDRRQQTLESDRRRLADENAGLRRELDDARKQIHRLEQEREFLTLSHRLADTPEALAESRRHIATLIRRLDSAISMLKEDPAL